MVRRSEDLSILGARGCQEHPGLHADEAGGHPVTVDLLAEDEAEDFLALAKYKQVYLKVTPINVSPKSWGKGSPPTLFGKVIERFGADRIAWGSNFPNSVGTLKEILAAARKAFSFAKASDQDWIFGKTAQVLYPVLKD